MAQTKKNDNKPNKAAETNIKLQQIQEAIEKAKGNPKKEVQYLNELIDPADLTACEGCQ